MGRRTGNPTGRPPTHGHTRKGKPSPEWSSWRSMICRCTKPKYSAYPNYGGRGIAVCERWMKFENFLADMGLRPEGTTLGRIDNEGNYTLENCAWQTFSEQNKNRRSFRDKKVVGYHRRGNRYIADISYKHKKYHLGCFDTAKEARAAYFKARAYYASLEDTRG
jgi:hypothetical protein